MCRRLTAGVGLAIVPAVMVSLLVGHFFTRTLEHALAFGPDEITYWRQAQAFSAAGFDAGYFNIHERPAAARFSRFGPHGPVFPMLYGGVARLTGWRPYSAPLLGVSLIGLALAAWTFVQRPPALLSAAVVATYWPMILYLPSTMQEPLHYAIAALGALLLGLVVARKLGHAGLVAALCAVAAAGLVRPTWALMAVPIAILATSSAPTRVRLAAVAGAVALAGAVYALFGWLAAPYPGSPMDDVAARGFSPLFVANVLRIRVVRGILAFVSAAPAVDLAARAAAVTMLVAAVAAWRTGRDDLARRAALAVASWLAVTLTALIVVGSIQPAGDVRLLGPAVLLALLLWGAAGGRAVLAAALLVQLALAPWAIPQFVRQHEARFLGDHTRHLTFRREVGERVAFQPEAASGWTNTVLMPVDLAQDQALLGLPAGLGLSAVLQWEAMPPPWRSRYVLLRSRDRALVPEGIALRPLARTLVGTLYENTAAR